MTNTKPAEQRAPTIVRTWGTQTIMERFMSKVKKTSRCWIWMGKTNRCGYGNFTIARINVMAHRYAYHNLVGPIPYGLTIDHLCRNRACVRPSHLEPVTMRENLMRGNTLQAHNANKTHCVNGHEFTPMNTRIVGGWRQCRECCLIRKARSRAASGAKVRGRYDTKATRAKEQDVLP